MGKQIGLIDADLIDNGTKHPNLALMKMSAYHKELFNEVTLLTDYQNIHKYDKVYISKVFTFTKTPNNIEKIKNVKIGGTGFFADGGKNLPKIIEHHMPDYSLYNDYINNRIQEGKERKYYKDYLDYSIGFTTRGCFRQCEFCVNKKYDKVLRHSPVNEFLDDTRKGIYLWDDNFWAFSEWESILDELENTNKPFQFRQGLDIRLLTKNKAMRFSKTKYHGDFIFAFDYIKDKETIINKLDLWRNFTAKTTKLYLLCAYERQDAEDIANLFERIKILMQFGCIPYIMRYELYKMSDFKGMYTQIARWCNQPQFYKKMSFRQFCEANQFYHKNKNTFCSAFLVMQKFEKQYPDIAKKYFDLRFEDEKKN